MMVAMQWMRRTLMVSPLRQLRSETVKPARSAGIPPHQATHVTFNFRLMTPMHAPLTTRPDKSSSQTDLHIRTELHSFPSERGQAQCVQNCNQLMQQASSSPHQQRQTLRERSVETAAIVTSVQASAV